MKKGASEKFSMLNLVGFGGSYRNPKCVELEAFGLNTMHSSGLCISNPRSGVRWSLIIDLRPQEEIHGAAWVKGASFLYRHQDISQEGA